MTGSYTFTQPGTYEVTAKGIDAEHTTVGTLVYTAGTFTELQNLINAAEAGATITLDHDIVYNEAFDGDALKAGIVVDKAVTIVGAEGVEISGNNLARVFYVTETGDLTLKDTTITNGKASAGAAIYNKGTTTVIDSTFTNNVATYNGGAIYNLDGDVTVSGANTFTNNEATDGGAIYNLKYYEDSSKLTIADSNINSNLELKSGNIDLNSVNFNNSILTITAANTTLVNVNVANGGIVVNGGKSKITKSNFTDSTNVITQNAGELELTNNIIKNNNNAINITGGSATISYNAIYNNTGNLTLTGATVTNNWFGTNQVTGYESYLRLVLTSTDSEMYPDTEYTIKVEFVPNTGSMYSALNDLTLDFTSTNGDVTSPVVISDNQGELKFTAGAISDEVKFTLLGEDYTLVNDDNPVSIVAKPLDTNLVINSSAKGVVVIKLTTAEGNVVGAIVSYSINGAEKINATTDDHGEIIIKDLTGKVEINATYAGNKTLNPITGNGAFDFTETTDNKTNTSSDSKPTTTTPTQTATAKTVKVASKIVAKKKTFKVKTKTKKYKITLKTKSGKAIKKVKVTLKVKGKTYKAKTNAKGVATFKITKLNKKGKYTAKIKFAGNKSYKATSKKIKLTVKK